jgi:hypothetical protein
MQLFVGLRLVYRPFWINSLQQLPDPRAGPNAQVLPVGSPYVLDLRNQTLRHSHKKQEAKRNDEILLRMFDQGAVK